MKNTTWKTYLGILTTGLVGGAILFYYRHTSDLPLFSEANLQELVDAFFIPGFLIAALGGLVVIDNNEGFDFIRYGFMRFWQMVKRQKDFDGPKTFYAYRLSCAEKPDTKIFIPLLLIGGGMLGVASILLLIYYRMYT
ncbi:MAG: DUF3899 domain-containing protein [bacterium]